MVHTTEIRCRCGRVAGSHRSAEGFQMYVNRGAIGAILALAAVSCGSRVFVEELAGGGGGAGGAPSDGTSGSMAGAATTDAAAISWTDPTTAPDCQTSPLSYQAYTTETELDALLVGRWRRCKAPQIAGEDVGVEF